MTFVPYAHVAADSPGVSDPASFPLIPRDALIAELEALGPAEVLAVGALGRHKLAGSPRGVKHHPLSQRWKQGYGVIIPDLGVYSDVELFGMAFGSPGAVVVIEDDGEVG